MKKLLIAFSMVGAGALIACAAGTDSQSNSVTTNYASQAWFGAKVTNNQIDPNGGNFSVKTDSESSFAAKDGKIEIDGDDVADPVSFKLDDTNTKTTGLAKVKFELDASVVPFAALPKAAELTGAKTAFALCKDGETRQFYAWVGATPAWTSLDFETIPEEDATYTLTMRFDDTVASAPKVQFAVGEESSAWFAYAGMSKTTKPQIDFVGCGKLKSMNADQVAIVSAEINFDGGKVTIAEKDATAMGKLIGENETIEDVLKDEVTNRVSGIVNSCKLTTAEAYAIGLIAKDANDTMVAAADGTFKVQADAQANVSDGIPVGFVTPLTPNDTSAAVTYTLKGSADGTTYSEITGMVGKTNINDIKIPTEEITGAHKYRFFKVKTNVTLKDAK